MLRSIALSFLSFLSISVFAQKEYNGLPDDLREQKIIFLNYEPINIPEERPKGEVEKYIFTLKKQHNKAAEQANNFNIILLTLKLQKSVYCDINLYFI